MTTWSARPSISAGPPCTADHGEDDRARCPRLATAPGHPAPGVERRQALVDVGARGGQHADDRHAELEGQRATSRSMATPSAGPMAPRCLPPVEPEPAPRRRPSSSVRRCRWPPRPGGPPRGRLSPGQGQVMRPGRAPGVALWPPKPNEFDTPGRRRASRGDPATTSMASSGSARSWLAVGGTMPSRMAEERGDRLDRAGGADEVAGDALGRGDRRRAAAEHLDDGLGLGGVVERRRRAVGVDVADVGRGRGRRRRGPGACRRRRRRRRATGR